MNTRFLAVWAIPVGILVAGVPEKKIADRSAIRQPEYLPQKQDPENDYQQGLRYADGNGVEKDLSNAARYYRKAAEKGHIPAQYNLAYLHENGFGVPRDPAEAARWYRHAATRGDAQSQNNLGVLYATGDGVPKDDVQAVHWYKLAARQDDPQGMTNLASMYLQGRGVARDLDQAFDLCHRAAASGYAIARNNLGLMFANGQGTSRDYVSAYAWLTLASDELPSAVSLLRKVAENLSPEQIEIANDFAARNRQELQKKH